MTNSPEMRALDTAAIEAATQKLWAQHAVQQNPFNSWATTHAIAAEAVTAYLSALSAPHAQGDVAGAVFLVICATPDGDQYGVFSTKDRAVSWADAQINSCIIVDHMVIDHPEFGNVASN